MEPETTLDQTPDFDALLHKLGALSRNHLLYFRIEVGRTVGQSFFGGDPAAFRDQAGNKQSSLRRFAAEHADELADLGLTETSLRQCLLAWVVVQDLPRELVRRLVFSHVVELSRVNDGATRRVLAQAIIDNGWNGNTLRDAVLAVRAGTWIDDDPAQPGLQPPPAPTEPVEPERSPQTGRVVTRFEKAADDLDALVGQWEQVPVEKLTRLQATRVREALVRLKERVSRIESRLG